MMTLPNLLSLMRIPLALLFLNESMEIRLASIFLASVTDFFDGYLARKTNSTSTLGTLLDPLGDKFFVFFTFALFYQEGILPLGLALCMLSRDFALIAFALYLGVTGLWRGYQIRAFWWGKVSTACQLFAVLILTLHLNIPELFAPVFIGLGVLSFIELYQNRAVRT